MRQLIARIDDTLHRRLKEKAAAQGRSLNALVTEVLLATASGDERSRAWITLAGSGKRVVPPRPARAPSRTELEHLTRGSGTAVSEALEAERGAR